MLWTTEKLSEATGLTQRHIQRLCKSGNLKCEFIGVWIVDEEDAQRFIAERNQKIGKSEETG